ncbi:MAG: hypothetical protein Q4F80_06575 [bacterium]|nr:hypothetical protein [bacterium]
MNEKLTSAHNLFYEKNYADAKNIFIELNQTYEAGLCSLLLRDLKEARKFFKIKEGNCPASNFGLVIIDLLEDKIPKQTQYFQVRSFLEIYINLLIENKFFDWGQKIIDNYEFFTRANLEVPKFIARVLYANNQNKAVHSFAKLAKELCFFDAEIHYIDASIYILEKEYKEAKKCIKDCLNFAPEYYPILKLQKELKEFIP